MEKKKNIMFKKISLLSAIPLLSYKFFSYNRHNINQGWMEKHKNEFKNVIGHVENKFKHEDIDLIIDYNNFVAFSKKYYFYISIDYDTKKFVLGKNFYKNYQLVMMMTMIVLRKIYVT
jgi:hypothetical protein